MNIRISEAIASGRLDPDQVPANPEDIRGLSAADRRAFFAAVYPPETLADLAADLERGMQLPSADYDLLQYMPISVVEELPGQLQAALMDSKPLQDAMDNLHATLSNAMQPLQDAMDNLRDAMAEFADAIQSECRREGISEDEYHALMGILNHDMQTNPAKYRDNPNSVLYEDYSSLIHYLALLKSTLAQPAAPQDQTKTMMIYSGSPIRNLSSITTNAQSLDLDNYNAGHIVMRHSDGSKTIIKDYESIHGEIGTQAKKLLDYAIAVYTRNTYNGSTNPIPIINIDMMEYWRACGERVDPEIMASLEEQEKENKRVEYLIKHLRNNATRCITNIRDHLRYEGKARKSKPGKNTDAAEAQQDSAPPKKKSIPLPYSFGYVSGFEWRPNNRLEITLDYKMARVLSAGHMTTHYYKELLHHYDTDANGYPIGRKLCEHHLMYNNVYLGTNNHLTVDTLLKAAPEIRTYEDLCKQGRRDWKPQIKHKLEQALNRNIEPAKVMEKWEYMDPKTGRIITWEESEKLTYPDYARLVVDFTMITDPDEYWKKYIVWQEKEEEKKKENKEEKKMEKQTKKQRKK